MGVPYKNQLFIWKKRREKIAAFLSKNPNMSAAAKQFKISRQRVSQIAKEAK
jgi:hypothetical protein